MNLSEKPMIKKVWTITQFENEQAFAQNEVQNVVQFEENVLLNEGITEVLKLICGLTATSFSNANARLGVGDDATAAAAGQTGLLAVSNKAYATMVATYPQVSGQTATWQATFDGNTANFAWNEFTVANGADNTAINLNRKVQNAGTKASGSVWNLSLAITLS